MSLLYIIYQAVQFFASIIGPGTIFLMLTGAFSLAFKGVDSWISLIINLIPVLGFIVFSFLTDGKTQVSVPFNLVNQFKFCC